MDIGEVRELKVKLSRKEARLKEVEDQLQQTLDRMTVKDRELGEVTKERDTLRLKNEILEEHL